MDVILEWFQSNSDRSRKIRWITELQILCVNVMRTRDLPAFFGGIGFCIEISFYLHFMILITQGDITICCCVAVKKILVAQKKGLKNNIPENIRFQNQNYWKLKC